MNGRFQMQGSKNWILPKELNATRSSETLVGWNWKNHLCPSIWDRMEGAWLWALDRYFIDDVNGFFLHLGYLLHEKAL
jgi:hypothetical protein